MSSSQLTLQSITGVDVELRVAGPGSRSYAFVIDWHIRILIAMAWYFAGAFLYTGSVLPGLAGTPPGTGFAFAVVLPSLAIYFLYHPVLEIAMHGRTPGKRIAGVRLVTREGDIPGPGALLLRNVFRVIDSLPFVYLVGLVTTIFTAQHVRIGDLAAGTLLILDGEQNERSLARLGAAAHSGLSPQAADLVHELLDRWTALDETTRGNLARSLIARIDRSASSEALAMLGTRELHARLSSLLGP